MSIREFIVEKVNAFGKAEHISKSVKRMADLESEVDERKVKVIYFAHPYNNDPNNKKKIEEIIKEYYTPGMIPISPINSFGFMYDQYPYEEGMHHCTFLLDKVDEIWMFGDWKSSRGCRYEMEYAILHGIRIVFPDEVF